MKRRSFVSGGLAGLAVAGSMGSTSSAQQPLVLRFGHNLGVGTPLDLGAKRLSKLVEERSGGKIVIRDYPGGQIGNEQQMLEGLQIGTLDMAAVVGSTYGNVLPDANVLGILFLFRDLGHMLRAMGGAVGDELAAGLQKKTTMHVIDSTWYLGTRQLMSANPVHKPEDMNGVKIRVVPVPIFEAGWRAIGATPTPIDYKDLFTALQTNVVSAQENPLAVSKAAGVQLVLKNMSMTDHVINNIIVSMSDDAYSRLKPEQLDLLKTAVRDAGAFQNETAIKSEKDLLEEFKGSGVAVIQPDKEAFRSKVRDLAKTFQNGVLLGIYNKIQSVQ